ncbi:unnamed protein product [Adineta steineri]|uniref:Uncharacterized protein n=1 Tax=Adineta steineri TaxID=433720 RepID=A0A815IS00_9BILA|nr:unnamed protein product [Adineta steineri]CAF1461277.1 unnamed protein product [Adineta steineri]CAF3753879.1 unnamed protein product [Adineta steineri]
MLKQRRIGTPQPSPSEGSSSSPPPGRGTPTGGWVCGNCKRKPHQTCEDPWSCDCQCTVGGPEDVVQKSTAIIGGIVLVVSGLALSLLTGGIGWGLVGGAMVGAGISSTCNGAEKAIKGERMNGKEYFDDVVFGALLGMATGGISAGGEMIAMNIAKQGVTRLFIRILVGALVGIVSKAIDELKQCFTGRKNWSDFGKGPGPDGNGGGMAASWGTCALVGGLAGLGSHISTHLTTNVTSELSKSAIRVIVSSITAATCDAAVQGINIAVGKQKKYDVKRTLSSAAVGAGMAAAQEITKNAIYRAAGGKQSFLVKRANREAIKKKVPLKHQQKVHQALKNLKKIPLRTLDEKASRAATYTYSKQQEAEYDARHTTRIQDIDSRLELETQLKDQAAQEIKMATTQEHKKSLVQVIKTHQQNVDNLKTQRTGETQNYDRYKQQLAAFRHDNMMNNDNAHNLIGEKVGQIAVDIDDLENGERGGCDGGCGERGGSCDEGCGDRGYGCAGGCDGESGAGCSDRGGSCDEGCGDRGYGCAGDCDGESGAGCSDRGGAVVWIRED